MIQAAARFPTKGHEEKEAENETDHDDGDVSEDDEDENENEDDNEVEVLEATIRPKRFLFPTPSKY